MFFKSGYIPVSCLTSFVVVSCTRLLSRRLWLLSTGTQQHQLPVVDSAEDAVHLGLCHMSCWLLSTLPSH
jgi:hypothetical protein